MIKKAPREVLSRLEEEKKATQNDVSDHHHNDETLICLWIFFPITQRRTTSLYFFSTTFRGSLRSTWSRRVHTTKGKKDKLIIGCNESLCSLIRDTDILPKTFLLSAAEGVGWFELGWVREVESLCKFQVERNVQKSLHVASQGPSGNYEFSWTLYIWTCFIGINI